MSRADLLLPSKTSLFTVPGQCPFRCVGCTVRSPSPTHESEAVVEHLRLVLAVVAAGLPLSADGSVLQAVPPAPSAIPEATGAVTAGQHATTRIAMGAGVEQRAADDAAAGAFGSVSVQPRFLEAIAHEGTPAAVGVTPAAAQPVGAISETGQYDLLRLLQGTPSDEAQSLSAMRQREPPAEPLAAPCPPPPQPPALSPPEAPRSRCEERSPAVPAAAAHDGTAIRGQLAGALGSEPPKELVRSKAPPRLSDASSTGGGLSDMEASAILNRVTTDLQEGKLSNVEAEAEFSTLIEGLSAGKLRCSALLNRAHCRVGLGQYPAALADIEVIVHQQVPGLDTLKWHKVWMSRGGIYRKLAQAAGDDPELYAKARSDYERVLTIQPPHEGYIAKARRCLEQLGASPSKGAQRQHEVAQAQAPAAAPASPSSPPLKRRRSTSRERSPPVPAASGAVAGVSPKGISADVANRCLAALGRECVSAGRLLFGEGAVQERQRGVRASDGAHGGAAETSRIFDIRVAPSGGQVRSEVVVLRPDADMCECSCMLRGHCKHVAAAFCLVEHESRRAQGDIAPENDVARYSDAAAHARRVALERRLEKKSMEELKGYLRLNHQLLNGTKPEVVRRVADAAVFGALGQCPRCSGHLHAEGTIGSAELFFSCRKQNREGERCGYEVSAGEVIRRPFIGAAQL
eukprot:gnl/TRDRNA2_/TRDRNA2_27589_c0_seq1.p1 gnl/TRDRNA2_/TRDRNA2_27589_c0~~gnl/TRDRNA2_/TRDRNA2_27589_c0_seq1.p1  ORF type:complete len:688 (+),score=115.77 gnl/TRDRNA2_/TRDRNA2_27589_c0_seq1:83-2146(+)